MLNFQQIGMAFSELPANKIADYVVGSWLDYNMYVFLKLWYLPMEMITYGDDVDKFLKQFSLNGIKTGNLCRPG